MKFFLITTTLLGLCAAAAAAPIGIGTSITDTGESVLEIWRVLGMDHIAADFDFPRHSMEDSLFGGAAQDTSPLRDIPNDSSGTHSAVLAHEPSAVVIVVAGLVFFGIAVTLRVIPGLRRRFKAERNNRRRRIKVELRMMA